MPKALWLLVAGMVINVTGASFLWPLNTIYIHEHLGKSLAVAGLVLMFNAGAGIIGNLFGGTLFDKIGGYRTIISGILLTATAITSMIFFHQNFYAYAILMAVLGFGAGMIFPAMYAMAGSVWPAGGRKAFNAVYVAQNLGVAIGAAGGGLVASYKFEYVFIANTVMYLAFLALAVFGFKGIQDGQVDHGASPTSILNHASSVKSKKRLQALILLSFGYLLAWMGYVQWQSTIAAYTQELNISLKQYSLLWTINGALIVLGQPLLKFAVDRRVKTIKAQILTGLAIFIAAFAVAGQAVEFTGFAAAMVILTIGEMFVWPAVPTAANELAPKGRQGFYQGIVNSTATGGRMLGPVLGGLVADMFGMQILFTLLIGFYAAAMAATIVYDRKLKEIEAAKPEPVVSGV
ncbi:MDR family MFS transporter [Bacillus marinisedimentorum]|uniref:MDR family MFS transporter n=1 Tax=Bacillus marinisedimentorum TaxID=1821260 RepID=UPI000871C52C|nr:MFS transporter [Bacillus marinisedimentorum]